MCGHKKGVVFFLKHEPMSLWAIVCGLAMLEVSDQDKCWIIQGLSYFLFYRDFIPSN